VIKKRCGIEMQEGIIIRNKNRKEKYRAKKEKKKINMINLQ
jgi:hypothetical protein